MAEWALLLRADLTDVLKRMKLLGFNAIRMPFSMQNLFGLPPKNFTWAQCTNTYRAALLANTQDPSKPAGNGEPAI